MKVNKAAWANASAILMGVVYITCSLLAVLAPGFLKALSLSWFHGIDLGAIWTGKPRGNFLFGLVTAVAGGWLTGWVFAITYNSLSKK